jgi:PAS domain S-box-containing protein
MPSHARNGERSDAPGLAPSRSDDAITEGTLAAIIKSSDDAIVSKDLGSIITSWNPAAERIFGYTAAEAVGRSIRMIIPEARRAEEDEVLRRIVRGEAVEHFETVRRRKDGTEIFVSITVSPIRDARGVIVGASKIARDVTQRIRESQRSAFLADLGPLLAASLDYERTLTNIARLMTRPFANTAAAFADYVLVDMLERDGQLRRVAAAHSNPELQYLLEEARRYAPDPARGTLAQPLRDGQPLLVPEVRDADIGSLSLDADHMRIMRTLGPRSLITVPLTARGTTFGLFSLVRSTREHPFDHFDLALAVEIAQRAALAVDNGRLYAEAREAVRAREHVLAVVSHDLRNSLGAIATSARLLLLTGADEAQRTRRLQTMMRVSDRMIRLMQSLLDVSRLQAGHAISIQPSDCDVNALIREACEGVHEQMEEKFIALQCDVTGTELKVSADRERTLQVLSNLLSNAIKFTPEGGSIALRAEPADDFVQFSVSDTGPGIRAEDLAHIFERYWQATRTAALGTGLGLAIVKGIVEAHGGTIRVETRAGVGSTFYFTLPTAPPQART